MKVWLWAAYAALLQRPFQFLKKRVLQNLWQLIRVRGQDKELVTFLQGAKEAGCKIALDDFGSEHSNWKRLMDYDIDIIKLDKSLTCQLIEKSKAGRSCAIWRRCVMISGRKSMQKVLSAKTHLMHCWKLGFQYIRNFCTAKPFLLLILPVKSMNSKKACGW